jgi:hypothetical protein
MKNTPRTLAQIQETIRAARDSVWVIADLHAAIAAGEDKLAEDIWPTE